MLCHDYRDHKNLTKVSAFTVPLGFVNSGCKDSNGVTNDNATKKATEINCKQLTSSWILQFNTS